MTPKYEAKITDNFLNEEEFGDIVDYLNDPNIYWSKCKKVLGSDDEDNIHYVHLAYAAMMPASPLFEILSCVHCRLHVISLYRVKVNSEPLHSKRYYSDYHYDYFNARKGTLKDPVGHDFMTTGILYLNTCDGYTEFEDGKIVESVANRFVEFPSNILHRGVSQTDTEWRTVINFNYFTAD